MRRTRLFGIVLFTALVGAGCEQSEQPNFLGPPMGATSAVVNPCPEILGGADVQFTTKWEILQQLYAGVDMLFNDVRSRNGAKSHLDNIAREICEDDYLGAEVFVHTFIQQVEGQPDDKLMETPSAADLIAWVQVLAYPIGNDVLPEGVLGVTGALALSTGGTGAIPVKTRNDHIIVNASDFPPGAPFVVAIAPGSGNFTGYVVFGTESYQIMTNYSPPAGSDFPDVLIMFCGAFPPDLTIAHDKGTTVELLVTEPVDCTPYLAATSTLHGAPGWLRSVTRLAAGTLGRVLRPAPLYARAETGLGGRAKSFSPFALVYSLAELEVTCESRAAATLLVKVGAETACSDAYDGGATVDTILVPVGPVTVTASAVSYRRRHDIWYSSTDLTLTPAACPPKASTPAACTFTLPAAGGSLKVKLTGY